MCASSGTGTQDCCDSPSALEHDLETGHTEEGGREERWFAALGVVCRSFHRTSALSRDSSPWAMRAASSIAGGLRGEFHAERELRRVKHARQGPVRHPTGVTERRDLRSGLSRTVALARSCQHKSAAERVVLSQGEEVALP